MGRVGRRLTGKAGRNTDDWAVDDQESKTQKAWKERVTVLLAGIRFFIFDFGWCVWA
jgi:hypothetical protein